MQELTERPEDLIRSSSLLVLLFGDEACAPCHALRNRLDAWANRHPEAEARYVPIREHPETCAQMGIFSAPTVLITMDGQVVARESGVFSLDRMLETVERALAIRDVEPFK